MIIELQQRNHCEITNMPKQENTKYVEFYTEITSVENKENVENEEDKGFFINGTAIEETISRNKIQYKAEELKKAAESLIDVPLLKDHSNSVDSVVGRVRNAEFVDNKVLFKAEIMDDSIKEKIQKGLIKHVSIGSEIQKVISKVTDGVKHLVAQGIEFLELSLVAVPGVPNATFAQAIEAYTKENEVKMVEEKQIENNQEQKSSEISLLKEQLTELKNLIVENKQDPPKDEKEEDKKDDSDKEDKSEEKFKQMTTEMDNLKESLKNVTTELANNKSKKTTEKREESPFYVGEIQKDKFGNYTRQWNYEQWRQIW